jgi:hypothetical protein
MIDIWIKFVSYQFEIALNLTRTVLRTGSTEAPASVSRNSAGDTLPGQAKTIATNLKNESTQETVRQEERFGTVMDEAESLLEAPQVYGSDAGEVPECKIESQTAGARCGADTIPGIVSFLDSASRGATVAEIAKHLEVDKKTILPLLKTLVKERKIDELLGRYYVLES